MPIHIFSNKFYHTEPTVLARFRTGLEAKGLGVGCLRVKEQVKQMFRCQDVIFKSITNPAMVRLGI